MRLVAVGFVGCRVTSVVVIAVVAGSLGLEVEVVFDRARFAGSGLFLFASVLERFFALYCSINSFTKMVALEEGRGGEIRKWPPRVGEKVLL